MAEVAAERLATWYPTKEQWQDAKRVRWRSSENPPATIDWLSAAMCPEDAIVVTDDTGPEWVWCKPTRTAELDAALAGL